MNSTFTDIQPFILQLMQSDRYTHHVILNTYRFVKPQVLTSLLRLWALNVVSRLFRGSVTAKSHPVDLFSFVAFLEFTDAGHPHYHLLACVHEPAHARLARVGQLRWRKILPGGQCHVKVIGRTAADIQRLREYVTKCINAPGGLEGFRRSKELGLPGFCHAAAPDFPSDRACPPKESAMPDQSWHSAGRALVDGRSTRHGWGKPKVSTLVSAAASRVPKQSQPVSLRNGRVAASGKEQSHA